MSKEDTQFKNGHPRYFTGKKVDENIFFGCLELFYMGRMNISTACKIIGISRPTLYKRWNHVLMRKEIPWEDWFIGYDKAKGDKMREETRRRNREAANRESESDSAIGSEGEGRNDYTGFW